MKSAPSRIRGNDEVRTVLIGRGWIDPHTFMLTDKGMAETDRMIAGLKRSRLNNEGISR